MRVLHVTNMYPSKEKPWYGVFISDQIQTLGHYVRNDVYFINGISNKSSYFKALFELSRLRGQYDIIHSHHGWCGLISRCIFRNEKHVLSLVGGDILEKSVPYKRLLAIVVKNFLGAFHHVIVKSAAMSRACNGHSHRVSVIPNGVDMGLFRELDRRQCKAALNLNIEKKYFLFTAAENDQRRREKRYDIIESAMEILQSNGVSDFEVLCLSDAPHTQVPIYINACQAILLPSDYEGSPNIVKEALACNTAVISTDVGNVSELISGLDNCHIIEQDARRFAEAMMMLMGVEDARCDGRKRIQTMNLEAEYIAHSIYLIYRSVFTASGYPC